MSLGAKRLYPAGGPAVRGYELLLGGTPHRNADARFIARTTKIVGRRVRVPGATRAGVVGLSCGASCSPLLIDFVVGRVGTRSRPT